MTTPSSRRPRRPPEGLGRTCRLTTCSVIRPLVHMVLDVRLFADAATASRAWPGAYRERCYTAPASRRLCAARPGGIGWRRCDPPGSTARCKAAGSAGPWLGKRTFPCSRGRPGAPAQAAPVFYCGDGVRRTQEVWISAVASAIALFFNHLAVMLESPFSGISALRWGCGRTVVVNSHYRVQAALAEDHVTRSKAFSAFLL